MNLCCDVSCGEEAECHDGVAPLRHISGKLHKKVWIAAGHILSLSLSLSLFLSLIPLSEISGKFQVSDLEAKSRETVYTAPACNKFREAKTSSKLCLENSDEMESPAVSIHQRIGFKFFFSISISFFICKMQLDGLMTFPSKMQNSKQNLNPILR